MPSASASEDQAAGRLSVTRVWRDSARSFRAEWSRLLVLSVAIEVPVFLFSLVFHPDHNPPGVFQGLLDDDDQILQASYDALIVSFYVILGHHLLLGVIERLVGADREGHPAPRLWPLVRALPWWKLVLSDVVLAVAINVGLVLFVVPGVLVAIWFTFVPVVLSFRNPPVVESFRQSRELVRGNFAPVFWISTLAMVTNGLLSALMGGALGTLVDTSWMEAVAHTLPAALLAPIFALPVVVAFFDLRALRGEAA